MGILSGRIQGRKRNFHSVTNDKIKKMMECQFQVRSEAKIKWAVKAYHEWRIIRLDKDDCETEILHADLDDTCSLTKQNLEYALCRFIVEVKKSSEDADYPGRTLYQIACALQSHLRKCNIMWKLVHGDKFRDFNRVLDKVMQEHVAMNIGTVK